MRALGSPKIPRTVPSGRKPGNAYASQSRRFRFAGAGIQNLRILSTPPHAQNPAMMRLYEVLTPEITHTTFQKTQKKEVRGGALLTTVRSYNPHNARGALSLLYLAGSFPGDFRTPACPGPGSLVVSHPPVSETLHTRRPELLQQAGLYSITSSARMVAWAGQRHREPWRSISLSSYLVGVCTATSAGFSPLRILTTKLATLWLLGP